MTYKTKAGGKQPLSEDSLPLAQDPTSGRPRRSAAASKRVTAKSGTGKKKASARSAAGSQSSAAKARSKPAPGRLAAPVPEARAKVVSVAEHLLDSDSHAPSEHEEIARLAYSYWEARGRQGGSPEEDWYRAQTEIRRSKQRKTESRKQKPAGRAARGRGGRR